MSPESKVQSPESEAGDKLKLALQRDTERSDVNGPDGLEGWIVTALVYVPLICWVIVAGWWRGRRKL